MLNHTCSTKFGLFIGGIVGAVLTAVGLILLAESDSQSIRITTRDNAQQDAVRHGAGRYGVDDQGKPKFEFIDSRQTATTVQR